MNKDINGVPNKIMEVQNKSNFNMNDIVGKKDILFLCYDSLRYDVAKLAEKENTTPNINQYGLWQKYQAPGNFTYTSHHAIFAGFMPIPYDSNNIFENERLFFPKDIGLGRKGSKNSFEFEGGNIVEGLSKVGYETICIGGVTFFSKRTELGRVFPNMFNKSYWTPKFSPTVKESVEYQVDFIERTLKEYSENKRIFMYINMTTTHYPTFFYSDEKGKEDTVESQKAALEYTDSFIPRLIKAFEDRGGVFTVAFSDHGSCFGENGKEFHGINNEIVNTIPYMEFLV